MMNTARGWCSVSGLAAEGAGLVLGVVSSRLCVFAYVRVLAASLFGVRFMINGSAH